MHLKNLLVRSTPLYAANSRLGYNLGKLAKSTGKEQTRQFAGADAGKCRADFYV